MNRSAYTRRAILALAFAFTLAIRVWGIDRHFWLLEDQIRDWSIALGPLTHLPLVGPPTHVGGYTIGPAFYWILWIIRVTFGPWFQNLPHAGGIGQAALQSAADTLLLAVVWRRAKSVWIALTAVVLLSTAAYDLCLSALVWNPMMGTALAKIATALVLLELVAAVRALARGTAPAVRDALIAGAAIALVAPTAYNTLTLDRLLRATDNRVVVARALIDQAAPDSFLYQSGERYGYVPMRIDGRDVARDSRFDEAAARFDTGDPDWILMQRSPLVLYSAVPPSLDRVVKERYELVRRFPAGDDRSDRIYDQQDAFYLPLLGLEGITHPGPGFELYRRARDARSRAVNPASSVGVTFSALPLGQRLSQ